MFKELMVHLDGTAEDEVRLGHAEAIASRGEARITGLYTNPLPEYAYVLAVQSGLAPMEPVVELEQRLRKDGDKAIGRLNERFKSIRVPNEVCRIEVGASEVSNLCVSQARWADLFIATVPYQRENMPIWDELTESVMFEAGHGIYLVPPGVVANRNLNNVLIAWRDTRESARAVAEALPLLKAAKRTHIVMVDPSDKDKSEQEDIAAYFTRHGIVADFAELKTGGTVLADVLLNEAHWLSADLIVMGAYGHSRFREWILGGVTRNMIERSDVPILLAH